MKTMLFSSMLLALLLEACGEKEGCLSVEKGIIPWKQQQTTAFVPYTTTSVNCDGISEEYDGYYGEFSYSKTLTEITSRVRLKLINDGNEPLWAPETITVSQLTGCEYETRPASHTDCAQLPPTLYYSATESELIDHLTIHLNLYKTDGVWLRVLDTVLVSLTDTNGMNIELDTPDPGKHQAFYRETPDEEWIYFYYENQ